MDIGFYLFSCSATQSAILRGGILLYDISCLGSRFEREFYRLVVHSVDSIQSVDCSLYCGWHLIDWWAVPTLQNLTNADF